VPYASSPCALIWAFSLPRQSVSVPALIFSHAAAIPNSRGDSHHSAIEPASVTMHDEMKMQRYFWRGVRFLAAAVVILVTAYAVCIGVTWYQYGRVRQHPHAESTDALLDSFIPAFDVARRQHVRVAAPTETTFSAACEMNLQQSTIFRAIVRTRALVLGSEPDKEKSRALGLIDQAKAWGWGELAEDPGREILFGAVTAANPVFQALPLDEFAKFQKPGFVKIVWMLRVDPIDRANSVLSTETRVATADPASYAKFRGYWSWASPGMFLIRWTSLRIARNEAERRVRGASSRGQRNATIRILTILVAIVLLVHGLIHLMGTAVYARHAQIKGLSYKTALVSGHWELGQLGIAVFGWMWVLPAVGFVAAAVALLAGWAWWNSVLVGVTLVSLSLTILDWSNAFRGAVVDVAILALILAGPRIGPWFSRLAS